MATDCENCDTLNDDLRFLNKELVAAEKQVEEKDNKIADLHATIEEHEATIRELKSELAASKALVDTLDDSCLSAKMDILMYLQQIEELRDQSNELLREKLEKLIVVQ